MPTGLKRLDLNLLLVLDALLETRSVARTASAVSLTPSAVSHALARLRTTLGDPLFVRSADGLVATKRAEALAAPLRAALSQLEAAVEGDAGFDPRAAAFAFTVATTDFGAQLLLPRLLQHLATIAPGVQVNVRPLPVDVADALATGALDAMIGLSVDGSQSLYQRRLFSERSRCLARNGHPAVKRGKISLDAWLEAGHVLISPRGKPGSRIDSALARRGLSRRVVTMVPDHLVAPMLVAQSDLLLTAGHRLLARAVQLLPVQVVELPIAQPAFDVSLVWHARSHQDPAHRWLRELLVELHAELYADVPPPPPRR